MAYPWALVRTRRRRGSLIITLPKEFVEVQGISENEIIEITMKKHRVDGFGALKGIGPFTIDDEMNS